MKKPPSARVASARPIFDADRFAVAAVSVSAPVTRVSREQVPGLAAAVMAAARAVSVAMGFPQHETANGGSAWTPGVILGRCWIVVPPRRFGFRFGRSAIPAWRCSSRISAGVDPLPRPPDLVFSSHGSGFQRLTRSFFPAGFGQSHPAGIFRWPGGEWQPRRRRGRARGTRRPVGGKASHRTERG